MNCIMLVFGTRPEAIKMCPLIKELERRERFRIVTVVSGQHRELLSGVLSTFGVSPDHDLALMRRGQSQQELVGAMLSGFSRILRWEKPDLVLVHGDTTTTFAAALSCFYAGVDIGHVEAGLRTYDMTSPFPEEFNRRVTGLLARYHFAPTRKAAENLLREGTRRENVFVTGNTGIDALKYTVRPDYRSPLLSWAGEGKLVLLTLHRRESIGEPMERMLAAIKSGAEQRADARVLMPVHPNPAVREIVGRVLGDCPSIRICPPLDVVDFHNLMARSHMILTDSGGIQEEAAALGIPTLVLRDRTERPEGIDAGILRLAGTTFDGVYEGFCELYDSPLANASAKNAKNPYGDGQASVRIVDIIEAQWLRAKNG